MAKDEKSVANVRPQRSDVGNGYFGEGGGCGHVIERDFGKDGQLLVVPKLGIEPVDMLPHAFETKAKIKFPTIYLSPTALDDIRLIIEDCPVEISWMGLVDQVPNGFLINEVVLPVQQCNGGRTRMPPESLFELTKKELKGKDLDKLRFWGHSHVNMEPNPSWDDERQAREFGENSDWFITAIGNKKGVLKFTIHHYDFGLTMEDVPWTVKHKKPDDRRRIEIGRQMCTKVTELDETPKWKGVGAYGGLYEKGPNNVWTRREYSKFGNEEDHGPNERQTQGLWDERERD